MRVVYLAADGPLQGWTYALDTRAPINEEIVLDVDERAVAVYRVGQDCKLWFIHLLPDAW
jgi:hypothetical protein